MRACVESLLRQRLQDGIELRLTVVDNGCGLQPDLPSVARVEVLHSAKNLGFAGGHNLAMRRALVAGAE